MSNTVVESMTSRADRLARSLSDIRQTPLDQIPIEHVTAVVGHVVPREPEAPALDVAAFNSSI